MSLVISRRAFLLATACGLASMATALPMMQLMSSIIHVEEVSDIDGTYTSSYKYATKQKNSLVAAADVMIGDSLVLAFAKDAASVVVTKESVSGLGLYNPQTVDGSIVVDGFLASAYTTAVHPKVAHCSLAPIRWLYEQLPYDILRDFLGSLFATGSPKAAAFLPTGPSIVSLYGVWRMDRPD
jgi:hypothetical protein